MAYIGPIGSVVAFQGDPSKLQASVTGRVGASILGTVPVTQSGAWSASVVGTVGASVIGTIPVTQSGPWTASVVGTVGASVLGTVPVTQAGPFVASVAGTVQVTQSGAWTASVVGTVGASVIGTVPVTQAGAWTASVVGTVGASIIGTVPVVQSGTVISSISGAITVASVQTAVAVTQQGAWTSSVVGTVGASVIGTVPVTQAGAWTASVVGSVNVSGSVVGFQGGMQISSISGTVVVASIVGTFAEDSAATTADPGINILGVRNDTVSSVVSADKDYSSFTVDSAGRTVNKPFAPEESAIRGVASVLGATSVLTIAAAGTGLKNYITDVWLANSGGATTLVTFTDSDASVLGKAIVPASGGNNLVGLNVPMVTSLNKGFLAVSGSATSILSITAHGYKAP